LTIIPNSDGLLAPLLDIIVVLIGDVMLEGPNQKCHIILGVSINIEIPSLGAYDQSRR
jgi:hypothetical protein